MVFKKRFNKKGGFITKLIKNKENIKNEKKNINFGNKVKNKDLNKKILVKKKGIIRIIKDSGLKITKILQGKNKFSKKKYTKILWNTPFNTVSGIKRFKKLYMFKLWHRGLSFYRRRFNWGLKRQIKGKRLSKKDKLIRNNYLKVLKEIRLKSKFFYYRFFCNHVSLGYKVRRFFQKILVYYRFFYLFIFLKKLSKYKFEKNTNIKGKSLRYYLMFIHLFNKLRCENGVCRTLFKQIKKFKKNKKKYLRSRYNFFYLLDYFKLLLKRFHIDVFNFFFFDPKVKFSFFFFYFFLYKIGLIKRFFAQLHRKKRELFFFKEYVRSIVTLVPFVAEKFGNVFYHNLISDGRYLSSLNRRDLRTKRRSKVIQFFWHWLSNVNFLVYFNFNCVNNSFVSHFPDTFFMFYFFYFRLKDQRERPLNYLSYVLNMEIQYDTFWFFFSNFFIKRFLFKKNLLYVNVFNIKFVTFSRLSEKRRNGVMVDFFGKYINHFNKFYLNLFSSYSNKLYYFLNRKVGNRTIIFPNLLLSHEYKIRFFDFSFIEKLREHLKTKTLKVKILVTLPQRSHSYVKRRDIFDNFYFSRESSNLVENRLFFAKRNITVKTIPYVFMTKVVGMVYHKAISQFYMILDYGFRVFVYMPFISFYNFENLFSYTKDKFRKFYGFYLKKNFRKSYKVAQKLKRLKYTTWNDFYIYNLKEAGLRGPTVKRGVSEKFLYDNYKVLESFFSVRTRKVMFRRLYFKKVKESFGSVSLLNFLSMRDLYLGRSTSCSDLSKFFLNRHKLLFFYQKSFKNSRTIELDVTRVSFGIFVNVQRGLIRSFKKVMIFVTGGDYLFFLVVLYLWVCKLCLFFKRLLLLKLLAI